MASFTIGIQRVNEAAACVPYAYDHSMAGEIHRVVVDSGPSILDYLTFATAAIALATATWAAVWTRRQGLAVLRQTRASVGPVVVVDAYDQHGCELTNHGRGAGRILDGVLGPSPLKFESVILPASASTRAAAAPRDPSQRPTGVEPCVVLTSDVSGSDYYVSHAWRPAGSGFAFLAVDVEGPFSQEAALQLFTSLTLRPRSSAG